MMFWSDKHRRFRDWLSAYIDGELDAAAAERLEVHLEDCRRCRDELEQLRATVAALRDLPQAQPRRSFALSPEQAAAPRRPLPAPAPLAFGMRIAAAGVAVALAAVLVVDIGDLGGDGAPRDTEAPTMLTGREADRLAPEPGGEPTEEQYGATPAGGGPDELTQPDTAAQTPAAPADTEAPAAAPGDGGIDALTAAEIGLAAALGVLLAASLALAFAGGRRLWP